MTESSIIAERAVEELQRERRAADITYQHLADVLNVSRQTLSTKLRSASSMRLTDFVAISNVIGVQPNAILAKAEGQVTADSSDGGLDRQP